MSPRASPGVFFLCTRLQYYYHRPLRRTLVRLVILLGISHPSPFSIEPRSFYLSIADVWGE